MTTDTTVLVLGSTGAVGRQLCATVADRGMRVLAASRSRARAVAVAEQLPGVEPVLVVGADRSTIEGLGAPGVVAGVGLMPGLSSGWAPLVERSATSRTQP